MVERAYPKLCQGKIKLTKKEIEEEMPDECHNIATQICEDCGGGFCHNHINRDKHKCDDSIKGCHSVWKEK